MKKNRTVYEIGRFVYLIHDKEQMPRMITAIMIKASGVEYELSLGTEKTWHHAMEVSSICNELLKVL